MADFHQRRRITHAMECRLDYVVRQNFADAERVFGQHCDNLLHRNDFGVFLDARVLSPFEMALIRNARSTLGSSGEQIDFGDAWVKVRDFRQIHTECPYRFQWRIDDDALPRTEWWFHLSVASGIEELPDLRPVSSRDVVCANVSTALERFESCACDLGKLLGSGIGDIGIVLGMEQQHL